MLNIAVVGPGLIGKEHIRKIQNNPNTNLSAIVAPDHKHNHDYAKKLNTPLFQTIEECIIKKRLDGIIIASPNRFHADQAKICIENRIPVLIEKPIASTVEEGRKILALSNKYQSKVLIGHHRAHSPILSKAKEIIQSGQLGKIVSITGSAQFYKPEEYFLAGPWRTQKGGGPILINLIHEIGNLRSLCGEISAIHAFSSSSTRGYIVEDTVSINLSFKNGILGNFILSDTAASARSWEQTSQENPAYPNYRDEDCYVITGTLGSLSVPTFRFKYYKSDSSASWLQPFEEKIYSIERKDPLSCQLSHFVNLIHGKDQPLVSANDGLINLIITEAISKSAMENRIIYTEY